MLAQDQDSEDWYWQYRRGNRLYRWWPRGWEFRQGQWGQWWEVWVAVVGGDWQPLQGPADGEGRGRRRDQWRWRAHRRSEEISGGGELIDRSVAIIIEIIATTSEYADFELLA